MMKEQRVSERPPPLSVLDRGGATDVGSAPACRGKAFTFKLGAKGPEGSRAEQGLDLPGVPESFFLAIVFHVSGAAQELNAVAGEIAGHFLYMKRRGAGV